jgi:endonuclease G, mitochondrial
MRSWFGACVLVVWGLLIALVGCPPEGPRPERVPEAVRAPPLPPLPADVRVPDLPPVPDEPEVLVDDQLLAEISLEAAGRHVYAGEPLSGEPLRALDKLFFEIGYSDAWRNPLWVSYRIGPAVDLNPYPRRRFLIDHETSARVSHDHYTNSGYSRGHMAPRFAISSRHGKPGNDATFVMSNVCPQFQQFNAGHWNDLEEWVAGRKVGSRFVGGWGDEYEQVWVTVGPIFDELREPLASGVEVPSAFYCIVLDEVPPDGVSANGPDLRVIAFTMEHVDARELGLSQFLTSVDDIERRTGLDFFSRLPDPLEDALEGAVAEDLWPLPEKPN